MSNENGGWLEDPDHLIIARIKDRSEVLGPGARAVVWLQGCPFRCVGCVVPEMLPFAGGERLATITLAEQLAQIPGIEGVTFSGGEPLSQAAGLCTLLDRIREIRPEFSAMSYTGHQLARLLQEGDAAQRQLLTRLDILIDGPYLPARHTDKRWRGSDNQQVHFLSARYAHLCDHVEERGRWMELDVGPRGELQWAGIPDAAFRKRFSQMLLERGIQFDTS